MTAHWTGPLGTQPFGRVDMGFLFGPDAHLGPAEIKRVRMLLLAVGILALLGGIAAIIVPIVASVTMTLFIGWMLMFYGVVSFVRALRAHATRSTKLWRVLNAVLAFAVGFYLVVLPLNGTITLTFLLAVWFFGTGVFSLASAWEHRGVPGAGWMAFDGVLSVVLGLLIAFNLPSSAAWAIGLLVGIYLLWWGTDALMAAWLLARRGAPAAD
jgi:uncharacterized membrane protein HdeD (DUF308 family)